MRRRFYWLLVVLLLGLAEKLPVGAGRWICSGLARFALRLRPHDRRVAEANLARAFPGIDESGRRCLLGESVTATGRNLFDTLAARRLLDHGGYVFEAVPGEVGDLVADLAAPGRGVFILTGHLGCWELLGGWMARELKLRGLTGPGVVTGTIHNPPVDRLLQDRRRRLGLTVLPREEGAGPLLRHLKSGGIVAVLQDQFTRVQNRDIVFFGQPAPTPVGLGRLALKYDIPVLPVAIGRRPDGRHQVWHRPPLVFKSRGLPDEDMESFLTLCNQELEHFIRGNPAEWVWFHQRWPS